MKIKHIIFDFDGVIGDTFDILLALSYRHAINNPTHEDFLAHHDGNIFETPRVLFTKEKSHLFFSEYTEQITSAHIKKAIHPIRELSKKYSLYINSSNREEGLIKALTRAGILSDFTMVMGEETHKSKVEKFKMVFDQHAATLENTLFITDSLGDVREAAKIKIRTIAVTFGFHNRMRLLQGDPFAIVNTWSELLTQIENLN